MHLDLKRSMPHHLILEVLVRGWLVILVLLASPVQAAELPEALRGWLTALDSAPTAAQVRRAGGPKTAALLDEVARKHGEVIFVRNRAVGLLSLLDDAESEARLRKLLQFPDEGIRATAALAWLAGPARRHPQGVDATVVLLLSDRSAAVRSAAARGLNYLPNRTSTRDFAVRQRARESDATVRASLDAAIRKLDETSRRQ